MPVQIRTATLSDIDDLVTIENAAFDTDRISRNSFRRIVGSDAADVLVGEEDRTIVAYAALLFRKNSRTAWLYSIATRQGSGGRGHGTALISASERAAAARGCTRLRLEVREGNVPARSLYEACGYSRIAELPGYYQDGATAHRYTKIIAPDGPPSPILSGMDRKSGKHTAR